MEENPHAVWKGLWQYGLLQSLRHFHPGYAPCDEALGQDRLGDSRIYGSAIVRIDPMLNNKLL